MIETERLIIRPWQKSEAAILFKYASDPDIGPIAGWPPHSSVENSLEIIHTVFSAPARCLKDLMLDAVWCGYYDGNTKSKRVCEKCGFRYHHTNRDIISPLGDKRTEHFYIMTKEEYQAE